MGISYITFPFGYSEVDWATLNLESDSLVWLELGLLVKLESESLVRFESGLLVRLKSSSLEGLSELLVKLESESSFSFADSKSIDSTSFVVKSGSFELALEVEWEEVGLGWDGPKEGVSFPVLVGGLLWWYMCPVSIISSLKKTI